MRLRIQAYSGHVINHSPVMFCQPLLPVPRIDTNAKGVRKSLLNEVLGISRLVQYHGIHNWQAFKVHMGAHGSPNTKKPLKPSLRSRIVHISLTLKQWKCKSLQQLEGRRITGPDAVWLLWPGPRSALGGLLTQFGILTGLSWVIY